MADSFLRFIRTVRKSICFSLLAGKLAEKGSHWTASFATQSSNVFLYAAVLLKCRFTIQSAFVLGVEESWVRL
jgi:hypothetical protein